LKISDEPISQAEPMAFIGPRLLIGLLTDRLLELFDSGSKQFSGGYDRPGYFV
jgi:hypothetical protein